MKKKGSANNKKKRSTITIGNGKAVAVRLSHDNSRINTTLTTIYRLQKESGWCVCVEYLFVKTEVYLCCSYLMMDALSFYPAVGGRGSGASAHRFPLPWRARTDTARRVKADIESYRSTRSARDLVKVPYLSLPK